MTDGPLEGLAGLVTVASVVTSRCRARGPATVVLGHHAAPLASAAAALLSLFLAGAQAPGQEQGDATRS